MLGLEDIPLGEAARVHPRRGVADDGALELAITFLMHNLYYLYKG